MLHTLNRTVTSLAALVILGQTRYAKDQVFVGCVFEHVQHGPGIKVDVVCIRGYCSDLSHKPTILTEPHTHVMSGGALTPTIEPNHSIRVHGNHSRRQAREIV